MITDVARPVVAASEAVPALEAMAALWSGVLEGNADGVADLLSDRVAIVDPLGRTWSKQDLIDSCHGGALRLEAVTTKSQSIHTYEALTSATTVCRISGSFHGTRFSGLFRHILVWMYTSTGLQVVAGGVCRLAE